MNDGKIKEVLCKVMLEIASTDKWTVEQRKSSIYYGLNPIMNVIYHTLLKYKILVIPDVLEQKNTEKSYENGKIYTYCVCKMRYEFFAEDGSSLAAVVLGEAMDDTSHAAKKAMADAFMNVCCQIFGIPSNEIIELETMGSIQHRKKKSTTKKAELDAIKVARIYGLLQRKHIAVETVLLYYHVDGIEELSETQYLDAVHRLQSCKDKL